MDLNGIKPQRERQPNWSEHEKQLLLWLTRKHQPILEHKGNDSMILKRKSDAWIEISTQMNGAGYYRSIDKLKQQLGRNREAEKSLPSVVNYANINNELPATRAHEEDNENTGITTSPNIVENDLEINVEVTSSTEDKSNNAESVRPSPTSTEEHSRGTDSGSVQQNGIWLIPQYLMSLDTVNTEKKNDKDGNILYLTRATGLVSPLAVAENYGASNLKTQSIDNVGCNVPNQERTVKNKVFPIGRVLPRNRASPRVRLASIRTLTTTDQRMRQIQKYRLAIQHERLKIQQMRDRKEVETTSTSKPGTI